MNFKDARQYILDKLKNDLPEGLYYHGLEHTLDVEKAAERIALSEGIKDSRRLNLLKTAALFHDAGYLEEYFTNERTGCKIAAGILPEFGYSEADIQDITRMIVSTEIPQHPETAEDKILCDADLDYLGRDDFFEIAENLRNELAVHWKTFTDEEWLQFEIDFLEKHRYFTETSRADREERKQEHIRILKTNLKTIA
jgi:HD superfamily phosphodiesterase